MKAPLKNSGGSGDELTRESPIARWTCPERAFVVIALLFGTALVLIIPPFQSADEPFHFLRAYQITDGVFVCRQMDARGIAAGDFPVSLYKIWLPFSHIGFHPEIKASVRDIREALRVPLNKEQRMLITLPSTAHYSPVCYLPQCIGIFVGRVLGAGPLVLLYLGREANLLIWILMGYFALRSAPAISRPVFLLLLMPMSLYVAATNSADVPTNAIAILFTAAVCRFSGYQESNSISAGQFLFLLLLSMVLCLCKFGYAPLLMLILLIPPRNFGSRGQYIAKLLSLVVLSAGISVVWISLSSNIDTRINMSADVSASRQLAWLVQHPLHFAPLMLETFHQRGWTYFQSYVGLIGWLDVYVPTPLVIGYLILLALACLVYEDKSALPPAGRAAIVVLPAVACSFLIMALLSYLYWTPVRASFIDGIHGRYLIPLSPAFFILIRSIIRRAHLRLPYSPRAADVALPLISLCICIYFVGLVWMRYYR